jgi:hypothetical protein
MKTDIGPTGMQRLEDFPGYGRTPDGKFYCFTGKKWVKMTPHCYSDGEPVYGFRHRSSVPDSTSYRKVSEVK